MHVHNAEVVCVLTGRIVPDPLSGYLGGWGESWRGPERPTWIILTKLRFVCLFSFFTHKHACTHISCFGFGQPSGSYSVEDSWGASAVACGVRCGRTEVGRWGRRWRCRGWTGGRRWWAWPGGCCGGVPAGRGCGGNGHTAPAGRGRPGGEGRTDWLIGSVHLSRQTHLQKITSMATITIMWWNHSKTGRLDQSGVQFCTAAGSGFCPVEPHWTWWFWTWWSWTCAMRAVGGDTGWLVSDFLGYSNGAIYCLISWWMADSRWFLFFFNHMC